MNKKLELTNVVSLFLSILYPLIVYIAVTKLSSQIALPLLALIIVGQLFLLFKKKRTLIISSNIAINLILVLTCLIGVIFIFKQQKEFYLFYPVLISFFMLSIFSQSLLPKQTPIIERIARITKPDLESDGIIYTRKVTKAWCLFFIINAGISLYTIYLADMKLWAIYNSFISYLLIGSMFAGEFLYRKWVRGV